LSLLTPVVTHIFIVFFPTGSYRPTECLWSPYPTDLYKVPDAVPPIFTPNHIM